MEVRSTKDLKREKANGWRILLVDDDERIRTVMMEILHLFGHEAESVASGEEALAAFDEARHALLITDHDMPGMQGAELIQTLRRRCPSPPIIALTGADAEEELLAAGAIEILKKPCDILKIKQAVERGLTGKTTNARGQKEKNFPYAQEKIEARRVGR